MLGKFTKAPDALVDVSAFSVHTCPATHGIN